MSSADCNLERETRRANGSRTPTGEGVTLCVMSDPTTAALARAQDALANAGAATAALARVVLDEQKAAARDLQAALRDAERRAREADRRAKDADAALARVEQREAKLQRRDSPGAEELRAAYRRGYSTGYAKGRSGRPADVERALDDPRSVLRAVS